MISKSNHEILFRTNVGSHMWNMNHEQSDTDIFECYILPTREILKGRLPVSHFTHDEENKLDTQRQEISKVTSEIIKSNLNYVGYIFSPIVLEGDKFLKEYRKLASEVISKEIYHSIRGMAIHNYKRYQTALVDNLDTKRWSKIIRVLEFGIHLINTGEIEFKPVNKGNKDIFNAAMMGLDYIKDHGSLRNRPSETDIENLWNFVIEERIKRL